MSIRIIIADDHLVFIDGMKALLNEVSDIQVVADAENGEQLIEKVKEHLPDIVLTDLQMPVKDGIAATKEIKRQFPDIQVIALTMLDEGFYIKKMLEAGASGYVLKTAGKDELINAIKKVFAGEKHFPKEVMAQLLSDFSSKIPPANSADILTKRDSGLDCTRPYR